MKPFRTFRSILPTSRAEVLLRDLSRRQALGELSSKADVKIALTTGLRQIDARNRIASGGPVLVGSIVASEEFGQYFRWLGEDTEVLFNELRHSDTVLQGLFEAVRSQNIALRDSYGQTHSEMLRRQIQYEIGSGWSATAHNSFAHGDLRLLDRSERSSTWFRDHDEDSIPQAPRIEPLGGLLTLPVAQNEIAEFRTARLVWVAGTTPSTLPIENRIDPFHAVDGDPTSFWSYTVGTPTPLLGSTTNVEVRQVAGTSGLLPTVDTSALADRRRRDLFVHVDASTSGHYVLRAQRDSYGGPHCIHDAGSHCRFHYDETYSLACANLQCARFEERHYPALTASGTLDDGYGYELSATIGFPDPTALVPGQAWKISLTPSGTVGARLRLEADLTMPTALNWIEITPVSDTPYEIEDLAVVDGTGQATSLLSGSIWLEKPTRFVFAAAHAQTLRLDLRQPTYRQANLHLRSETQTLERLASLDLAAVADPVQALSDLELESILARALPSSPLRDVFASRTTGLQTIEGYFYQIGLFEIRAGLEQYADRAVAITRPLRARAPVQIGLRPNTEPDLPMTTSIEGEGMIEYSFLLDHYDASGRYLGSNTLPYPILEPSGTIRERLFLDDARQGTLRFLAETVNRIEVVDGGQLNTDDYTVTRTASLPAHTQITIAEDVVPEDALLRVTYTPLFGSYLDARRSVVLADNRAWQQSVSDCSVTLLLDPDTIQGAVAYTDLHLKIVLRRNDHATDVTPVLRDYQILVTERDPERFF